MSHSLMRPAGLILVGGIDWAFDLRDIRVDASDIVYSAHIYPNRGEHSWEKALDRAGEVPVFVGEWGGAGTDLDFGRTLADRMRQLGLGWTAWSWVDYPPLIKEPRSPLYQPTAFGELVRSELQRDPDCGKHECHVHVSFAAQLAPLSARDAHGYPPMDRTSSGIFCSPPR